jgi:hypothetical protein
MTEISGLPSRAPAIYESGMRSPEALIVPLRGTTGMIPAATNLKREVIVLRDIAECPRTH